ncbi:MAG TPA: GtrA family protein [Rhizomicrobium sp.]|nr:GtrA family protein [Rhizomicrobium sp.]
MIRLGTIAQYFLRHAFVRFAVIGACGYAVGATILALGTGPLKLDFAEANALAIFIAMAFTWQGNRYFTFRAQRARGLAGALQEWLKFMGANALGAVVNYLTALALVHYATAPLGNKFVAQAIGVLVGLVFNFTLSKTLVFKGAR